MKTFFLFLSFLFISFLSFSQDNLSAYKSTLNPNASLRTTSWQQELSHFKQDLANGGYNYYGYSQPGTADGSSGWYIKKENVTTGEITVSSLNSPLTLVKWTNRTTITYY